MVLLEELIEKVREQIKKAEAVVIGAGAGLSTAAGFSYSGQRFERYFHDFITKYHLTDMYLAGFYPFDTQEEKWAYWSRHIYYNRYDQPIGKVYLDLLEFIKEKNYFVITTNVDHQFWLAGFKPERIFATQGDYGLFQCAKACHKGLYENEAQVREMLLKQKECKIPSDLVPKCPVCGGNMEVNLRCDEYFVEGEEWIQAAERYEHFLEKNKQKRLLLIELGVGMNTPGIIKYPFWQMTNKWKNSFYLCINQGQAWAPKEIEKKSICINSDIAQVFSLLHHH